MPKSLYRVAQEHFRGEDEVVFINFCRKNRTKEFTLALGYFLFRAAEHGKSQSRVAEEVGVSRAYISALLSNAVIPSDEILTRLEEVLNTGPGALHNLPIIEGW